MQNTCKSAWQIWPDQYRYPNLYLYLYHNSYLYPVYVSVSVSVHFWNASATATPEFSKGWVQHDAKQRLWLWLWLRLKCFYAVRLMCFGHKPTDNWPKQLKILWSTIAVWNTQMTTITAPPCIHLMGEISTLLAILLILSEIILKLLGLSVYLFLRPPNCIFNIAVPHSPVYIVIEIATGRVWHCPWQVYLGEASSLPFLGTKLTRRVIFCCPNK